MTADRARDEVLGRPSIFRDGASSGNASPRSRRNFSRRMRSDGSRCRAREGEPPSRQALSLGLIASQLVSPRAASDAPRSLRGTSLARRRSRSDEARSRRRSTGRHETGSREGGALLRFRPGPSSPLAKRFRVLLANLSLPLIRRACSAQALASLPAAGLGRRAACVTRQRSSSQVRVNETEGSPSRVGWRKGIGLRGRSRRPLVLA